MIHCSICNEDKEIVTPGKYSNTLSCGHITLGMPSADMMKIKNDNGNSPTMEEADNIAYKLNKTEELPEIDKDDLVRRALESMTQHYEDFFTNESALIEEWIEKYGRDKASMILLACHDHLSKVLFTVGRFRNAHFSRIEALRKEVESQAVKDLIANHDFYYNPATLAKKPIKPRSPKLNTELDKAKVAMSALRDKDGNALDLTSLTAKLMWGSSKKELAEKEKKEEYQAGLDKIKNSIISKDKENDAN